ncbi:MAG: hypothetical protein EOL97_12660 [Spirochaetia bacterium]|nr:hypothetical protein [Spirochaetia bacterium]
MNKKIIIILVSLITLFTNNIFSTDLIVLKDGSVSLGKIITYEKDKLIKFEKNDGTQVLYDYSTILTSRTNIDVDNLISQSLSPTYNMIKYYPRKSDGAYEISPRYTYKGQTFTMESKWGRVTQILEFFDMLDQNQLNNETKLLINELESKLKKNNNIISAGAISQLVGMSLLFVPYFVMDESTDPVTIPSWANITGLVGLSADLVGLGLFISQINFNQDKLVEQIAISFNQNLN